MSHAKERIWLIGASAGIGRALAAELAREGALLALSARSEDALRELQSELDGEGHYVAPLDVQDDASIARAWQQLCDTWGVPDKIVYLAGVYTPTEITDYDAEASVKLMDINVNGLLRVLGHVLPVFIDKRHGELVLFGSVAGYRGLPKAYDYSASKAAINIMAESLRVDLAPHDVSVRLISPGFVKTRLTDQNDFDMLFRISPEEAAQRIVKGLKGSAFEVHFPKRFTYIMKMLRVLPHALYLWLAGRML